MCIGLPLQVVQVETHHAWCEADGQRERIDMSLIGAQPVGTWLLAFNGAARQVLDAEAAAQARAGRQALAAVLSGSADLDHFFTDLAGRTPRLPDHLQVTPAREPS